MKDFIITCVIAFFFGGFSVLISDYLDGFLEGLKISVISGYELLNCVLVGIIVLNRTWLRFEQKEGE